MNLTQGLFLFDLILCFRYGLRRILPLYNTRSNKLNMRPWNAFL